MYLWFFFSSRRRHTRCALVTEFRRVLFRSQPLLRPIDIGPVRVETPVILAPMTAVTDRPFRAIVKRYGAALTVTELIASPAMVRETRQSLQQAEWDPIEHPVAMQLAGSQPHCIAEAATLNAAGGAAIT